MIRHRVGRSTRYWGEAGGTIQSQRRNAWLAGAASLYGVK
jgi:hypothetical protein